jgi:hypothetical protein
MGIIICQSCECTIDHFEDIKVTVLYGKCSECKDDHKHSTTKEQ